MADTKLQEAKRTYSTLCAMLDDINWRYDRDDANLVISTSAVGEDLSIKLRMVVSADRQVMYVKSAMPFKVPAGKEDLGCKAVTIANYSMLNGCFEYDMSDGYIGFKIVVPFMETAVSKAVCNYMVMLTCQMVDKFNDKLLALFKGTMSLSQYKDFVEKN